MNRSIIDWRGFSIAAGEHALFAQSGPDSAVLNRVTGGEPSALLGRLSSNGQVFLVTALNLGTIDARNAAGVFAGTLRHSGAIRAGRKSATPRTP